jgi:hypothetical protein
MSDDSRSDGYCNDHGIRYERLDGYDRCPKCRLEEDAEAREREMHERRSNPDMHNSVDARRR